MSNSLGENIRNILSLYLGFQDAADRNTYNEQARKDNDKLLEEVSGMYKDMGKSGDTRLGSGYAQLSDMLRGFQNTGTAQANAGNASLQAGYNKNNEGWQQRIQDVMGGYGDALGRNQQGFANLSTEARNRERMLNQGYETGAQGLNQAWDQRTSDIMGQFDGLGDQQREDLRQEYANRGTQVQQDMASRGLGGTTGQTSALQGNMRAQQQDMRRLNEGLTRERIGYETGLTGDALSAKMANFQGGQNMAYNTSNNSMAQSNVGLGYANQDAGNLASMQAGLSGDALQSRERALEAQHQWQQEQLAQLAGYQGAQAGALENFHGNLYQNDQNARMQDANWRGSQTIAYDMGDNNALMQALGQMGGGSSAPKTDNTGAWIGGASSLIGLLAILSDQEIKEDVRELDHEDVLTRATEMPVTKWRYKPGCYRDTADHVGPMAQDFMEAFGLGEDDININAVDAFGVAMSCIKALADKVERLEARTASL